MKNGGGTSKPKIKQQTKGVNRANQRPRGASSKKPAKPAKMKMTGGRISSMYADGA